MGAGKRLLLYYDKFIRKGYGNDYNLFFTVIKDNNKLKVFFNYGYIFYYIFKSLIKLYLTYTLKKLLIITGINGIKLRIR